MTTIESAQMKAWLRKHAFVFAAAFLFVVIAVDGLVSFHELATVMDRFQALRGSDAVLGELNETLGALRDAETGQRGYRISADPDRLQQIVWNLVSNAVKFTPRGGPIDVRLQRTDSKAVISVQDSGEGIDLDPEFLPYVFDPFRQADASKARVHKGLGLGLSIVSNLTQAHGGTVSVTSAGKGEGATFSVALPIMPFTRGEAVAETQNAVTASRDDDEWPIVMPKADALAGLTILAVDDHRPTLDLLTFVLRSAGATVIPAANAADGYGLLSRSKPDVMLSDVGMPGEDGLAFIAKVRRLSPQRGGDVPAIALTAYVRQDDRDSVLSSGFQAYLAKPIEPMALVSSILEVAALRRVHTEAS